MAIQVGYWSVLLLWLGALALLLLRAWKGSTPVVGLTLAYWLHLWMMHWIAGLIQVFPWHKSEIRSETMLGFLPTGYAMCGLVIGALFLAPVLVRRRSPRAVRSVSGNDLRKISGLYIVIGVLSFFVLMPFARVVPSLTSIVSGGLFLAPAGICLFWWNEWMQRRRNGTLVAIGLAGMMPTLTLLLNGFLSFGVTAIMPIATFMSVFYRPRVRVAVAALVCLFVGASLFPVYFKVRSELRRVIWARAALTDRVEVVGSSIAENWDWFDAKDKSQLSAIEQRLNHNYLLGRAKYRLDRGIVHFAEGRTMFYGVLGLIPRLIWPSKPNYAGGTQLVEEFTGLNIAANTSVSPGHIMDFYINFGSSGVFLGFVVMGTVFGVMDEICGRCLVLQENYAAFIICHATAAAMLNQASGSLGITAGSAVGTAVLCWVASRWVTRRQAPSRRASPTVAARKSREPVSL